MLVSNCCGVSPLPYTDMDEDRLGVCSLCLEHCELEDEDEWDS